ncbi:hypothetical protein IP88_02850 [alpha proteobacterium AAP81b]|nr:hypothetical protein IP88_02850 [alpha proteobacterium AAP81b]
MLRGPTTREFLFSTIVSPASRTSGAAEFTIDTVVASNTDRHPMFRVTERANQATGVVFDAVSVPMRNRDALAAGIDGLQLPNAGPDIMVTGQLTSCAFMYSADKNNMFCAHIEPTRAANPTRINRGVELGVQLNGTGETFTNDAGAVRYFTKLAYQDLHHVNIFGVRRGDGWSLYVQGISTAGGSQTIVFSKQMI